MTTMLVTFALPFVFMIVMKFGLNRVWSLYNMLQLLVNLKNYTRLVVPANLVTILDLIQDVVYFSPLDDPVIQKYLKDHVFGRLENLQAFLVGNGMFVTTLIFTPIAIGIIILGTKVKPLRNMFLFANNAMMWSSLIRS